MKPYIYKVTDKVTGEFYIGSQCRGKVIGKNYFTSSKNKIFKNKFKSNPAQFEIKIIGTFTNPESCILQENIFIKFYIKNPLCLNKNYVIGKEHQFCMSGCTGEKNPFYGKQHSKETKYKISEANKGRLSARKGCHLSDETRKKLSELKKGNTPWNKGKSQYFNRRKIICIETQIVYSSAKEAGISNNIAPSNVTMCAQHTYKQAGGFHLEYADSHIPNP